MSYKVQIENELNKHHWEISTIGSTEAWWDDEYWLLSCKYTPDTCFYLCFIVDLAFEDSELIAWGFSQTGKTLVIADTSDLIIYGRNL